MRTPLAVALTVAVIALAGCAPLERADPEGHAACTQLMVARTTTDVQAVTDALLAAGVHASRSTTEAIAAAATELGQGTWSLDATALAKACRSSGVKVPGSGTSG